MYIKLYKTIALRYPPQFGRASEQQHNTLDFLHLQVVLRWPFFIPDAVRSHTYHSIETAACVFYRNIYELIACEKTKQLRMWGVFVAALYQYAVNMLHSNMEPHIVYQPVTHGDDWWKRPHAKAFVCVRVCLCVWLSKSALYQRTSITQFLWAVCFQSQQTAGPAFRTHED